MHNIQGKVKTAALMPFFYLHNINFINRNS